MKILAVLALALLCISLHGCDSRSNEFNRGYQEGYQKGKEEGESAGYSEGYSAGYSRARPAGWSPTGQFGQVVLGLTATLGGLLALGGAVTLIALLLLRISHPLAVAAKGTVVLLAGLSAWVLTTIATTERLFFELLLSPVPESGWLLLIVILVFGAATYGIIRWTLSIVDNIKGVRLETFTISVVTFVAAIILQAFIEAIAGATHLMAYMICYVLIGVAVGAGLHVVRLLILGYEEEVRKERLRRPPGR